MIGDPVEAPLEAICAMQRGHGGEEPLAAEIKAENDADMPQKSYRRAKKPRKGPLVTLFHPHAPYRSSPVERSLRMLVLKTAMIRICLRTAITESRRPCGSLQKLYWPVHVAGRQSRGCGFQEANLGWSGDSDKLENVVTEAQSTGWTLEKLT